MYHIQTIYTLTTDQYSGNTERISILLEPQGNSCLKYTLFSWEMYIRSLNNNVLFLYTHSSPYHCDIVIGG